ncbi:hypothetical protein WN48_00060 [Eufriesea mexicana]|nr:hypothetical protein WN48_00060 [Eufriesea mexicana]
MPCKFPPKNHPTIATTTRKMAVTVTAAVHRLTIKAANNRRRRKHLESVLEWKEKPGGGSGKVRTGYPTSEPEESRSAVKRRAKRMVSGITFSFRIQHCRARRVCRSRKWPSFFPEAPPRNDRHAYTLRCVFWTFSLKVSHPRVRVHGNSLDANSTVRRFAGMSEKNKRKKQTPDYDDDELPLEAAHRASLTRRRGRRAAAAAATEAAGSVPSCSVKRTGLSKTDSSPIGKGHEYRGSRSVATLVAAYSRETGSRMRIQPIDQLTDVREIRKRGTVAGLIPRIEFDGWLASGWMAQSKPVLGYAGQGNMRDDNCRLIYGRTLGQIVETLLMADYVASESHGGALDGHWMNIERWTFG